MIAKLKAWAALAALFVAALVSVHARAVWKTKQAEREKQKLRDAEAAKEMQEIRRDVDVESDDGLADLITRRRL